MQVRRIALASMIGVLVTSAVTPAAQPPPSGKGYALLVGIANYAEPGIPSAAFADRDALAVARTLSQKLGQPYAEVVSVQESMKCGF